MNFAFLHRARGSRFTMRGRRGLLHGILPWMPQLQRLGGAPTCPPWGHGDLTMGTSEKHGERLIYPPVNVYITMENHHF